MEPFFEEKGEFRVSSHLLKESNYFAPLNNIDINSILGVHNRSAWSGLAWACQALSFDQARPWHLKSGLVRPTGQA